MATLVSTTIDRILRKFQSQDTPDILTVAMGTSDSTFTYLGFLSSIGPGSLVSIEQERVLVTEVDQTNKVATVVRGYDGTTAASHAKDSIITVHPRGDRSEVMSLINDCLNDMFPDLYQVSTAALDYSGTAIGYELPTNAYKILEVTARMESGSKLWEPIHDWDNVDSADTSDFSTGRGIMVRVSLPSGAKIRVKYGTTFSQVSDEADDLEADSGLADYMTDLPYYYALSRMLPAEELLRSQIKSAQAHQRAQDVPGFLALRTGEWYAARYQDRKRAAMKTQAFINKTSIGTGYGT